MPVPELPGMGRAPRIDRPDLEELDVREIEHDTRHAQGWVRTPAPVIRAETEDGYPRVVPLTAVGPQ